MAEKTAATKALPTKTESTAARSRPARTQTPVLLAEYVKALQRTAGNRTVERLFQAALIQSSALHAVSDQKTSLQPLIQYQDEVEEETRQSATVQKQETAEEEETTREQTSVQTGKAAAEEKIQSSPALQYREDEETLEQIQRQPQEDEPEVQEKPVPLLRQTKASPQKENRPAKRLSEEIQEVRGQGEPLAADLRQEMEAAFDGEDFGAVRIHRDETAVRLNTGLRARAFTNREDIHFNRGEYHPSSSAGKHLLAHELTHVVQQRTIPDLQRRLTAGGERNHYEQEADAAADRVLEGLQPMVTPLRGSTFKRAGSVQFSSEKGPVQFGLLGSAWRGIKKVAKGAADLVGDAVDAVGSAFSKGIDWVISKVKPYLRMIPGYDLLGFALGKDPVTGEPIKRDGAALVKGITSLAPGGKLLFENLEKTGAIPKAMDWLGMEIQKLGLSWDTVKSLFFQTVSALSIRDVLNPGSAITKLKQIFLPPVNRIITFAGNVGFKIMEFIFEGALAMAGAPVEQIMGILNKGKAVLMKIIGDPISFIKNLFNAVVGGIGLFKGNVTKHLMGGVVGWLFGTLAKAGLTLSASFDLPGVFSVILQFLDLTWLSIRSRIVKALGPQGEKIMGVLEKTVDIVRDLVQKGPIALWDWVKDFIGNLKSMFFDAIIDWVKGTIVFKAIETLISFFNPAGAIIQAVIAIYNTVRFFMERIRQIKEFAMSVLNSIIEIAGGNVTKAAAAVENAMVRSLPVIISFLARIIRLGGISERIRNVIQKIRKPIDVAIKTVIGWIVDKAKLLLGKGKALAGKVKEKVVKAFQWWKARKRFKTQTGESHTVFFDGEGKTAQLMIASQKTPYVKFINQLDADNDPEKIKAKNEALKTAKAIDSLRIKAATDETGVKDRTGEFKALLDTLSQQTKIFIDQTCALPASSFPEYGTLTGGFGSKMTIKKLTKIGPSGSKPTVSSPAWETLNLRRRGRGSFYVLGHLLNQKLHGLGNNWQNMTPISRSCNAQHESLVESQVKKAVDDNCVVEYTVCADYKRPANPLIATVQQWCSDVKLKKDKDRHEKILKVMQHEQYTTDKLICTATIIGRYGKQEEKNKAPEKIVANLHIKNKIDDEKVENYEIH